ncbi:MAG TPA: sugar phosphate isomerase/epimerase [Nitrospirae bacterium]|nr:sugar phosphate isomerase/epimerase [Nitrospirota bacterium]
MLNSFTYTPSLTVHGPFMDLSPGAVDPLIRKVTMERFSRTLNISGLLRARNVVFHSGYEKWKYEHRTDLWLESSLRTWEPVLVQAEAQGLTISIENIFEEEPENLRMLAEAVNSRNFGLCFDAGHFNLFSTISLKQWLSIVSPYLLELHLHDNDGTRDSHMPPGKGVFDFKALFDDLEVLEVDNLIATVETHSIDDVKESIRFLGAA